MRIRRVAVTVCAMLIALAPIAASAQQAIVVVRHAERASVPAGAAAGSQPMMAAADDPPLSTAGQERAARLATMLRSADIRHVFATEFLRTRQTASPAAQALHLETAIVAAKDPDALVAKLREVQGNALVVGHSNTIPDLLKRLGVKADVRIDDAEYDNVFIVVRTASAGATMIRLRY